jgi:hypothetical protein
MLSPPALPCPTNPYTFLHSFLWIFLYMYRTTKNNKERGLAGE